jgi:dTDP-4-dehydrorhamnose reductase
MRALITGSGGQVGRELVRAAPPDAEVHALSHGELDISDEPAVQAIVKEFAPTLIINAAAYTAVDRAETERERAWQVNALAPRLLAEAAAARGDCRLIHISTDYVFSGESSRPYEIDAAPAPINEYGRSKLGGERAVLQALATRALIVRSSWVYSAHERNFLHTMLRLMRAGRAVRVVADQIGSPTSAASLAMALWAFAVRPGLSGLHHWTDAGVASWYDFAVAIADQAAVAGLIPARVEVSPIAAEDYPTAARRPACSLLDKRHTIAALGAGPEHWARSLNATLRSIPPIQGS